MAYKGRKASPALVVLLSILTAGWLSLYAYTRELAESTLNPVGVGLGTIGTNVFQPAEGANINPANLGPLGRPGGGLNFGLAEQLFAVQGLFFLPSSLGVIGIAPLVIQDTIPGLLDLYLALPFGYGRQLTQRFSFGFYLKPAYGDGEGGAFFALGIEPALVYQTQSQLTLFSHFGLYNFSFYLQARNLALNLGNSEIAPRASLQVGFQTTLYHFGLWQINWYSETYGIHRFDTIPLLSGISIKYWQLYLRLAGMYSQENQLQQGISLGSGIDIPITNGNIALHYALLPPFRQRKELIHFISAYGSFGFIDREGPVIELKTDVTAFSPDANGVQDYVNFDIKVSEQSAIRSWRLEIKNSKGEVVRFFENDQRKLETSFGLKDFFKQFFTSKEALVIPRRIRWDGTSNALSLEQATGEEGKEKPKAILPDGEYFYLMTAIDEHNNPAIPVSGSLFLDTTSPQVKIYVENKVFSPNGDQIQDELKANLLVTGLPEDNYYLTIENEQKEIIKSFHYTTNTIPNQFMWDGSDHLGRAAPEGLYTFKVTARDAAGNQTVAQVSGITLVRRFDSVELQLSGTGFSPNGDKRHDTLSIKPTVSTKVGLESWEIVVTRKIPEVNRPKPELVIEWSGFTADSLPQEIIWDGKDGAKRNLPDGVYYITMRAFYHSGNQPQSRVHPVVIDTTPPIVAVEAELNLFSPDGDGIYEEQVFRLDIQDASALEQYRLNIYEIQYDDNDRKSRLPFKVFSGTISYPPQIYWDGKSDSGNLVESATWYEYELTAVDIYGNLSQSSPGRFETDILVIPTERGLKIRLSAIEFDSGKATLKKQSYTVLSKLAQTLQRYPAYQIKIEGHTDNVGAEEFNLKLSEDRARTVMNYLIQEGIDPKRLTFQGMGELYPILPNTNWYNRSRNRRVELILIR